VAEYSYVLSLGLKIHIIEGEGHRATALCGQKPASRVIVGDDPPWETGGRSPTRPSRPATGAATASTATAP